MEFIQKYAKVDEDSDQEFIDDEDLITQEQVGNCEFIDDVTEFDDQEPLNYFFKNVERDFDEAALDKSLSFLDEDNDPKNYCQSEYDRNEIEYDIFLTDLKK